MDWAVALAVAVLIVCVAIFLREFRRQHCPHCGKWIRVAQRYCPRCGAEFD